MDTLHTPWDFNVGTQQFVAHDHSQSLRYQFDCLNEIGMGGPLRGPCLWVMPDGKEVQIHANCGGPPVWQQQGNYVAISIWKFSWLTSWTTQIGVLEPASKQLILFKKSFKALHLKQFDGCLITGVDSPIYLPEALQFDTSVATIERIIQL
ncbi:hypothetical protein [Hymenobacter sp. B1770]|uniref:hypothetical protein n=1 Tax=Hymenobacter sp. B1770 TaxID=1718788 RepID=UPI003CF684BD